LRRPAAAGYGRLTGLRTVPPGARDDPTTEQDQLPPSAPPLPDPAPKATRGERLISLDAFRGLTVALMLLVNNAALDAEVPSLLVHAPFGKTPTLADMVFPWFLLAVGIAIPFSAASGREQGLSPGRRGLLILRRAVFLYLVGALIDSSLWRSPYWGLGVLQLIGLAYLAGRTLYVLPSLLRAIAAAGLLGFYAWALNGWAFAGYRPGAFTETHNLARHLNETVLAPYQMQGLFSVIPTAALVVLGTLLGDALSRGKDVPAARASIILAFGSGLTVAGIVWGAFLPMSKTFWTSSYIVFAAGWGTLLFFALYIVTDLGGAAWRPLRGLGGPLAVFGANALIAYAGAILVKIHILQEWKIWYAGEKMTLQGAFREMLTTRYGDTNGGWLYMAAYLAAVWLVCALLYGRKIYVRA
jgi:predicted acyltransferase